ncbi:MAG: class I SAM-dependent methyltransferase [Ruminococcaceae bacterium]|nr:class I SAM-dependent methyltransferase [Oscillospiraceae bacterium]
MSYSYFANVYDLLTENAEYSLRADWFCSLLAANGVNGGLLLDLACGTGNMSFEMADRGFEVIGVDLSEDMLSVAQQKQFEKGSDILFLHQDMRNLDLYGTVGSCICSLDSLNHLTEKEDLKKAFMSVSAFLDDGGIFVFDMNTPYKHREILSGNSFIYESDGIFCAWQNSETDENDVVDILLDFFIQKDDGSYSRFSEDFSERAYAREEVIELLGQTDFEFIAEYDEFGTQAPKPDSQRTVFVARRKDRK